MAPMRADLRELFTVARERLDAVKSAIDDIEAAVGDRPAPTGTPLQAWLRANPLCRWRLRQRPKLSQHQAAVLLDVASMSVSAWERGVHTPNDASLATIEQTTGISYTEWHRWLAAKPAG